MAKMESTKNAILASVEAKLDRRHLESQSHFDKQEIINTMMRMHSEMLKKVDLYAQNSQPHQKSASVMDKGSLPIPFTAHW